MKKMPKKPATPKVRRSKKDKAVLAASMLVTPAVAKSLVAFNETVAAEIAPPADPAVTYTKHELKKVIDLTDWSAPRAEWADPPTIRVKAGTRLDLRIYRAPGNPGLTFYTVFARLGETLYSTTKVRAPVVGGWKTETAGPAESGICHRNVIAGK